jgi:hypothetical protein
MFEVWDQNGAIAGRRPLDRAQEMMGHHRLSFELAQGGSEISVTDDRGTISLYTYDHFRTISLILKFQIYPPHTAREMAEKSKFSTL